jgi:hypothetical protein
MNIHEFYRSQSRFSDPGRHAPLFDALPDNVEDLVKIAQGLVIYDVVAENFYGHRLSDKQKSMIHLRHVEHMLDVLLEMDDRPLDVPRPFAQRLSGRCHHYELLFVSMLRHKGFAARERGGFAAYFNAPKFEDHVVAEYWDRTRGRWIRADAQLDHIWLSRLKGVRAPLALSAEDFVPAGSAWRRCREEGADPNLYGISFVPLQGLWFIAGSLIREMAALNKDELLPWDVWGAQPKRDATLAPEELELFDKLAELTRDADEGFQALHDFYRADDRVKMTGKVFNALTERVESVAEALSAGLPAGAGG